MRWILGISFLSVAVWALFPDRYDGDDKEIGRAGVFGSTLCAFFLAEIGDKTQIATIGLAARFEASIRSSSAQRSQETDTTFAIGWKGHYRIDGPAFVYSDQDTGRLTTILGYPMDKLAQIA